MVFIRRLHLLLQTALLLVRPRLFLQCQLLGQIFYFIFQGGQLYGHKKELDHKNENKQQKDKVYRELHPYHSGKHGHQPGKQAEYNQHPGKENPEDCILNLQLGLPDPL